MLFLHNFRGALVVSRFFLVFSSFSHLICCGLPIILSFNSLLANLLLFESVAVGVELFESVEKKVTAVEAELALSEALKSSNEEEEGAG